MKHIKLFEQFIAEKKKAIFTARIEDKRNPGGSDKEIMDDYSLQVKNRDKDGFDIVGYKADIEAFAADYSMITMDYVQETKAIINEAMKVGRDTDLAKSIIKVLYAERGTPEADQITRLGVRPTIGMGPLNNEVLGLSGFDKDGVKTVSSGRVRVPSDFMLGELITVAADNGNSYYCDDVDFVEGDKTILKWSGVEFRDFIDQLVKLGVIEKPTY